MLTKSWGGGQWVIIAYFCAVPSATQNTASASQQVNRKENKQEASGTNKTYDIRIENFDISFGEK